MSDREDGNKDIALGGMSTGVIVLDSKAVVTFCNRAFLALFQGLANGGPVLGLPYADLLKKITDNGEIAGQAVLDDPHVWMARHLALVSAGSGSGPIEERLASGLWVRVEAEEAGENGHGHVLTFTDVTEYKNAVLRFTDAIENSGDGFALWDRMDRLVHCNQTYGELHTADGASPVVDEEYKTIITRVIHDGAFLIGEDEGAWIKRRMTERRAPLSRQTLEHVSGKWYQMTERRARDGGTVTVFSDITQLKRNEADLMTAVQDMDMVRVRMEEQTAEVAGMAEEIHLAKQEADRASGAKTDFLSKMSHDLRTPLNAILGFGQLLQMDAEEGDGFNDEQTEGIDQIMKAGEHLLELINEVLDLARIESGRTELDIEEANPWEIAKEAISLTQALANKRGVVFTQAPPDGVPAVMADKTRLRQIMVNLMSNAIKYNNENGSVEVNAKKAADGMVAIAVADTGPGIPEELCEGVFEPFNRAGADKTQTEGSGIGLAIVKSLVDLMEGRIELDSQVGEGSTFTVYLPQAADTGTKESAAS